MAGTKPSIRTTFGVLLIALGLTLATPQGTYAAQLQSPGEASPGEGLRLPDPKPRRDVRNGIDYIIVNGEILNETDKALALTPVKVLLVTADGEDLAVEIFEPEKAELAPGEKITYTVEFKNPSPRSRKMLASFVSAQQAEYEKNRIIPEPPKSPARNLTSKPSDTTQLFLPDPKPRRDMRNGIAYIILKGRVQNPSDKSLTLPPIRVSLASSVGTELAAKVVPPQKAELAPGEEIRYEVEFENPSPRARQLSAVFVVGETGQPKTPLSQGSDQLTLLTPIHNLTKWKGVESVLVVGMVANTSQQTLPIRDVKVSLVTKDGEELASKIITPDAPHVLPGREVPFTVVLAIPSPQWHKVLVTFVDTD